MTLTKAAILGATGPVGLHLANELRKRGVAVRAVARDAAKLQRTFPPDVETLAADVTEADGAKRALDGCDTAFHCIGLPAAAMPLHPVAARSVAAALPPSGARCVHVSSYWAFLPLVGNPLNEEHPRQGGPPWVRYRREAEDVLRAAGAAIANLPDFYGPYVHTSTLQQPLAEAARGKTMHWIGPTDLEREYAYVPDAAATVVSLAARDEAYGEHWVIPGGGPLTGRRTAELASAVLGRKIKVRGAGLLTLRALSPFVSSLRDFLEMAPEYLKPIRYESRKIERLLGPQPVTPYEQGIKATLDWLATR